MTMYVDVQIIADRKNLEDILDEFIRNLYIATVYIKQKHQLHEKKRGGFRRRRMKRNNIITISKTRKND